MEYKDIVKKLEGIEASLLSELGLLHFDKWTNNTKSIENFLEKFNNIQARYPTFTQIGTPQCNAGRNRSFGDIFCILKTYYPTAKLIDVYYFIEKLEKEGVLGYFRCSDIGKRVLWTAPQGDFCKHSDEYGIDYDMIKTIYKNYNPNEEIHATESENILTASLP